MKKAKLDTQGRIVIPKPFRKAMNIEEGAPLLITFEHDAVVVRPDNSICKLCGSHIESERTLQLCDKCMEEVWKYYISNHKKN